MKMVLNIAKLKALQKTLTSAARSLVVKAEWSEDFAEACLAASEAMTCLSTTNPLEHMDHAANCKRSIKVANVIYEEAYNILRHNLLEAIKYYVNGIEAVISQRRKKTEKQNAKK